MKTAAITVAAVVFFLAGFGSSGLCTTPTIPKPDGFSALTPREAERLIDDLRRRVREDRLDMRARVDLADILGVSENVEHRREAMDALSEALLIDNEDPDLWIRVARLQERRGFRREARNAYHQALTMAPERADLWNELAHHELRRFLQYNRDEFLDRAREANRKTLSRDAIHSEALRRAIRMACIDDEYSRLDSLCFVWEKSEPENPWPLLVRGMLFAESDAWELSRDSFETGIPLLSHDEQLSFTRLDAIDAKAEEERRESPDSTRFVKDFWRWLDPTPADLDNPRLMEHYARMVRAELLFAHDDLDIRGWDHAPGEMIVRYGVPEGWNYDKNVRRGEDYHVSNIVGLPTIEVSYGDGIALIEFRFVDYNLNGRFFNPISGSPSSLDYMLALSPSHYASPLAAPDLDQEVELWRFVDRNGKGRIEVAVALAGDIWPEAVFEEPYRLASKLTLYDPRWDVADASVGSWAAFERDHLGRLIGLFALEGTADSVIVGLETEDRQESGRGAAYAVLPPLERESGPAVSDLAFLSDISFDGAKGQYGRAYGSGLPNPGHRYQVGDPIEFGFETYHLSTGAEGNFSVRLRVTVGRQTRAGWLNVLLRRGQSPPEAELAFEVSESGSTLEQLLSVDVPTLEPGEYVLTVTVEDLLGGQTVDRSEPFRVLEPGRTK